MNKFQKAAYQIAKDDKKKLFSENIPIKEIQNGWYLKFRNNKSKWPYLKVLDFKNWNKKIYF